MRKRWLQFRLRSLILWVALLGLILGWWVDHRRSARRMVELEAGVQRLTQVLEAAKEGLVEFNIRFSYILDTQQNRRIISLSREEGEASIYRSADLAGLHIEVKDLPKKKPKGKP